MPFDMRPDRSGWTVYYVFTGRPVLLGEVVLVELELEDADVLVDLLNKRAIGTMKGREAGSSGQARF